MRNTINEYLEPDIKSKKDLWESAVFVFDTNILLNLYRYTQNTRDSLIAAISSYQDRIWMPHHVATEFMNNRCETIFETAGNFETLEKEVDKFVKVCKNSMRATDDNPEIMELKSYLAKWVEKHRNNNLLVENPSDDKILNKILDLYDGLVGKSFSESELEELYTEGEQRYNDQVPPGYKDGGKGENTYGDLILWKEILRYSKENSKDIIFITHDGKEDWWNKYKGKKIGPHVKLRKEFIVNTKQKFGMYTMNSFIEIYNDNKVEKLDQSVINEVNKINLNNVHFFNKNHVISGEALLKKIVQNDNTTNFNDYKAFFENDKKAISKAEKDMEICRKKINNKFDTITSIEHKYIGKNMPNHVKEQLDNTRRNVFQLEDKLADLENLYYVLNKYSF